VKKSSLLVKVNAAASNVPPERRSDVRRDVERLISLGVKTPRDAADVLLDSRRSVTDRATCCWAIKVAGDSAAVPCLLAIYRGSPATLTWEIATALTVLADEKIVPLMEALASRDVRPAQRAAAAYILGHLGSRHSGELLAIAFKKERSRGVRQAMVEAMGRLGGHGTRSAIEGAISDSAPGVRASACYAIGLMGLKHLIPKLASIASERRGWEAKSAEDALEMLRSS
jgi:HEAT repeat protein